MRLVVYKGCTYVARRTSGIFDLDIEDESSTDTLEMN
jgi:hypothetical protein